MEKKYWIWFTIVTLIILPTSFLLAGGLVPCGGSGQAACTLCDLIALFQNLLNLFIKVIIWYVALFLIMYAGFLILTDKNKKQGYDMIKRVLIGLVIILMAWTIVNTIIYIVGPKAVDGDGNTLSKSWNKIDCSVNTEAPDNGGNLTPGGGDGGGGGGGGFN